MVKFGIDIGGTTAKIALISQDNVVIEKCSVKTLKDEVMTLYLIREQIDILIDKYDISSKEILGIGIGSPGSVDIENGIIEYLPNLSWKNVKIATFFNSCYNVPVKVNNDANVATLAEMKLGSGKDYNNFVYVTLGTGVGGGIVINKQIYRGNQNKGAEIGHMIIEKNGKQCNCGRKGCFEAYASATALINIAKEKLQNVTESSILNSINNDLSNLNGKIIFDEYKNGDTVANEIFSEYITNLAEGLLNLMNIFRPDGIVVGGGISEAGDCLFNKLNEYCKNAYYGYQNTPSVEIKSATFLNDAGIIGAGLLIE